MPQYKPSLMLGLILINIHKCWYKFPWPFVAVEMFGLVSLGLVTPWSCVYLPETVMVVDVDIEVEISVEDVVDVSTVTDV